jgi:hypothetical protein
MPLLDPGTVRHTLHLGVRNPGVLADLAEQVLAVDEVE